jgi:hypothetical protein
MKFNMLNEIQKAVVRRIKRGDIPFVKRGCTVSFQGDHGEHACNKETMTLLKLSGYVREISNPNFTYWLPNNKQLQDVE